MRRVITPGLLALLLTLLALGACSLSADDDAPDSEATLMPSATAAVDEDTPPQTPMTDLPAPSPTVLPTLIQTATTAAPVGETAPNTPTGGRIQVTIPPPQPTFTLPPPVTPGGGRLIVTIPVASATPFVGPTYAPFETATPGPTATATSIWPETARDRYEAQAAAGRVIFVDYDVTLNQDGQEVYIYVRDPRGEVIGGEVITETARGTLEVTTVVAGLHEVLIAFERLAGGYSVTYGVR